MTTRNSLLLASFVAVALAAPLAFAQDTQAGATPPAPTPPATPPPPTDDPGAMSTPATPATPATPPTDDTTATSATPATPATPASGASPKAVNWSDLDTDKDGKLSRSETASIKSLTDAFDSADTDKDGTLTTDEYKAYLAAHGNAAH
jgi:hypothetical protein